MNNDLISRSALKILIEQSQIINPKLSVYEVLKLIDNAPTVELENIQSKLISKVAHSIAEQYLRHNEVVPEWLTIGDIRV